MVFNQNSKRFVKMITVKRSAFQKKISLTRSLLFIFFLISSATYACELPQGWGKYERPNSKIDIFHDNTDSYCINYQENKGGALSTTHPISDSQVGKITVSAKIKLASDSPTSTGGKVYLYLKDKNRKVVKRETVKLQNESKWENIIIPIENIPNTARFAEFGISVSHKDTGATCVDTKSLKWSLKTPNTTITEEYIFNSIFTRTWGNPNSTPIVLIHGNNEDGIERFSWLANELSKEYFVVAYDQRGFGKSDYSGSDYSFRSQENVLDYVINKYKLNEYSLLGHSFGARIATAYASIHPEQTRAIILVDMGIFSRDPKVYKYANGNPANCTGKNQIEIWGCVANLTDLSSAFKSYSGKILVLQSDEGKGYIKNINKLKLIQPNTQVVKIKNSTHFIHDAKKHPSASNQMKSLVINFVK